jgi:hypothetical protein
MSLFFDFPQPPPPFPRTTSSWSSPRQSLPTLPPTYRQHLLVLPRVVKFVEPAQVERAVFSTLFNPSVVFKFAVEVPESDPVPLA